MNAKLPATIKRKIRPGKGGPLMLPADTHPCALHLTHRPRPLVVQRHHLVPKYLQAKALGVASADAVASRPEFDPRIINLDGTSHDTVHAIIDALVSRRPLTVNARHLNEYALARMGFDAYTAMAAAHAAKEVA